jgi:rhamnosyltransferase
LENKYKFSKYILNKSYINNLLLLKYSFEFRRNKKEKLFLSLLILLGVF